jgi:hypothetical protein
MWSECAYLWCFFVVINYAAIIEDILNIGWFRLHRIRWIVIPIRFFCRTETSMAGAHADATTPELHSSVWARYCLVVLESLGGWVAPSETWVELHFAVVTILCSHLTRVKLMVTIHEPHPLISKLLLINTLRTTNLIILHFKYNYNLWG